MKLESGFDILIIKFGKNDFHISIITGGGSGWK